VDRKNKLTRFLAVTGTVMIWLPIFFTILTSIIFTTMTSNFRIDYLMPAELFPVALIGGLLLFWAAARIRTRHKTIGFMILSMFAFLAAGQILAVVTGLASGAINREGWIFTVVIVTIALYTLTLIALGINGTSVIKYIYRKD
jgi:hypothetical protein